jgi:3-deoxy-7-phosphoheptulonate synthase
MQSGASEEQIQHVIDRLVSSGFDIHRSTGESHTVVGAVGVGPDFDPRDIEVLPGVREVVRVTQPYKLANRAFKPEGTVVRLPNGVCIGGKEIVIAAGPCAVESAEQMESIASRVAQLGARMLRGGAYKPRTSPYSFQGLGEPGLRLLRDAGDRHGLLVVSEIMDASQLPLMLPLVDVLQVGARNMQNYHLLRALGLASKPVLLKRGLSATIEELLLAAEYIMAGGNHNVILCERGIRTYETATRNTLDLSAVPVLKQLTHLPVVVDPSHAVGKWDLVGPMAKAAVAAGADGLIIEVHSNPEEALSDGEQSLKPGVFKQLMDELRPIAKAVGREI